MESSGSTASKPGPIGVMKEVWKHHGIKGFWNGQTGTFLRETGGSACWFGAYEYVGATLRKRKGSEQLGNGEMMLAGAAGECFPVAEMREDHGPLVLELK
jgi:ornithine carrier protein